MEILDRLTSGQNLRGDEANIKLAQELCETKNTGDIKIISENLFNKNKKIASDCIKVLYEIGYRNPELIVDFFNNFIILLSSKNNRLVWGAMIALSTIAHIKAKYVYKNFDIIAETIAKGSVITKDAGIRTLANTAAAEEEYSVKIFSFLLKHLESCAAKQIPLRTESIVKAVNENNGKEFLEIIQKRKKELTEPQLKRLKKIIEKNSPYTL